MSDSSRTSLPCCAHGYPRAVSDEACPLCLKAALATERGRTGWLVGELAEAQRERDAIQETLTDVEHNVAIVYCHITDGAISKCNTEPGDVNAVADDCIQKIVDREVAEAVGAERDAAYARGQADGAGEERLRIARVYDNAGRYELAAEIRKTPPDAGQRAKARRAPQAETEGR